ncbi:MAG: asparagine--tRNA ligase, partial [Chlamydiales bacterium]|nr:asparagine--tRNA ligase [Chlamydiales bacterium]
MKNRIRIQKITASDLGKTLTVCGWVRTVRDQNNFAFIELNDGSTLSNLQIIIEASLPSYETLLSQLSTGAAIYATGTLIESPGQKQ